MRTSLFIPTLNGMPDLERVLDAVDRQPGARDLEKIAIDSGSDDGTVQCLQRHGFAVSVIDRRTFNHGATRDRGIAQASGEVVVLLTQDAIPADREWLPRLLESYTDPRVAAAYCKQIPREDCNPFIAQRLREWTAGKDEPLVQELPEGKTLADLEPMERLRLCAYDNVAGSVRRSAWQELRFGHRQFGEDVGFGRRAIEAGHRIVFQARSVVVHSHNRSPVAEGKRIYCDHQNLRELFDVHLVPDWAKFRENVAWARKSYGDAVLAMDLPEEEKKALHRWAVRYAFWGGLGMYLGGNAQRFASSWWSPVFKLVDRWMHRGI